MRSEKEIRNKIIELQELVEDKKGEINECVKNDDWCGADIHMNLANTFRAEINYLMWVLEEE